MTIHELENKLAEKGVPENMYSLLISELPNEAYCLIKKDDGWEVYYSERGKKRSMKQFAGESEACEHMYEKLRKYVTR